MDPLLLLSASEMAARIRDKSLSSGEAVEVHIAAIQRANPRLNAIVATRFEQARAEAAAADKHLAEHGCDGVGPFFGVPCTVKESFAVEGMPHTAGLKARAGRLAGEDAVTVARLRQAGAIPLGVSNTSELCMWMESYNKVYGRTNNPYQHGHICGGSSGGEGAIVGAGASPVGLGADIGGSIRMPAFFCGVFGHKPSGALVPSSGQFPQPHNDALRYDTTGPIARRAEDLMPFLRVVAGPDSGDAECRPFTLGDPASVSLSGLSVLNVADNGVTPVADDLRAAQQRVAAYLASRGAKVRTAQLTGLRHSLEIWSAMMAEAAEESFAELLGEGQEIVVAGELLRWALGRSPFTFPALALAILEKMPLAKGPHADKMAALGRRLKGEVEALIGPAGIMLYPSYASVAPRHGRPLLKPFHWVYTAIINVLELPSTQVPLGLNAAGLPLGVQLVACQGQDHITIAVAQELERAFGGWVPPAWWDEETS